MAQNKTLELSIKIAGKVDKSLTTAINQTNTLMGSLTTTMSKVGTAGLAAMGALATATVAGLAKCTSEAAKLENNMSAMVRYVDGLTESATTSTEQAQSNLKAMRTYIQDLSTQIPRTTEQISKMSAALGQSGIGADRQMSTGILRDTAVAATAMDLEDDTAGNYMAKWEAAFNFNHDQVMTLMDQINYLGANNATTAAEIAQSVNQAASMGQIAGVDPSATAAIATAMQATGVATDRVGTSISRIYTNISKGSNATKAQKAMWEELGFTAEGIARSMQSDGIGTLKSVFQAINNMPDERKVAALNTLFGQWAIEGGAKITQNLALLEKTLGEVNDPGLYTGSMEREFLIEASTPEAVDLMLSNAKAALMQDIGQAFLPAKKEFSLSMIDFLNQIRKNMPELTTLANSLGKIASDGVERLGDAMERALPYIQRGLDYLANNGPQVASTLGKLAAVFVGMKFAPGIESLLSGAGNLLLGSSVGGSGKRTGGLLGGIKSLPLHLRRRGQRKRLFPNAGERGIQPDLRQRHQGHGGAAGSGSGNAGPLIRLPGRGKRTEKQNCRKRHRAVFRQRVLLPGELREHAGEHEDRRLPFGSDGQGGRRAGQPDHAAAPGHRRHRCCGDHSRQHHPTEPIRPAG